VTYASYSVPHPIYLVKCIIENKETKSSAEIAFILNIKGDVYVKDKKVIRHMKQYETNNIPDITSFCEKEVHSLFAVLGDSFTPFI
jgi:hypothetical protein